MRKCIHFTFAHECIVFQSRKYLYVMLVGLCNDLELHSVLGDQISLIQILTYVTGYDNSL